MPLAKAITPPGLSPRLRGNRIPAWRGLYADGSIPAPAGEPRAEVLLGPELGVYPRACGGTTGRSVARARVGGLSPRLRGNRPFIAVTSCWRWSIPAPAGEPHRPFLSRLSEGVYPRACGRTTMNNLVRPMNNGLSPRLRGNRPVPRHAPRPHRSIPAPAGEPASRLKRFCEVSVYPRACGGTVGVHRPHPEVVGLSPRLRGNRPLASNASVKSRSIPAPAGEPLAFTARTQKSWVYPRACGGTASRGVLAVYAKGLSPRLRGNHLDRGSVVEIAGSIPAPAGEPSERRGAAGRRRVYPRACGGTTLTRSTASPMMGLSPRLRGNQCQLHHLKGRIRSIPAPAGEPQLSAIDGSASWVYPRACGGTCSAPAALHKSRGLSPRLRGNPIYCCDIYIFAGSIPAPAGEPSLPMRLTGTVRVYPRACGGTRPIKTSAQ